MEQKRILLAEDSREIRTYFCRRIRQYFDGIIDVAVDGQELLNLLTVQTYDLVLTDLCMPFMDADEVLQSGKDRLGGTPIFVMTAINEDRLNEIEAKIRNIGVNLRDILVKPLTVTDIRSALGEIK